MILLFRSMKTIYLPHLSVGDAHFRFICYSRTSGKFRLSHNIQGDDELLFLGADLINSTLHNNLHTKYWNKGLCVKIHLKDAIVKGIPNSTSLWFYTIQGVFHYTFAHLDLIQQKNIIASLLTYWMRLEETNSNLPRKMDVPVDLIQDELSAHGETNSNNKIVAVKDVSAARETHIIFHLSDAPEPQTESPIEASRTANSLTEDVLLADRQELNELNDIDVTLNKIASTIETVKNDEQRQGLLNALQITCRYFESQMPHGPGSFFPFNILETYLSIASPNGFIASEVGAFAANRHDVMLYVVSSWLGKEFLRMKRHVQDEIATFKQQYLHQLDQLPKPKAIVQELFPACMVELLERWLGVGNEQINQEHSYFKNSVQNGGRRMHQYPIIQLILEFVNETLILGTSHALYTQLASMPE